MTEKIKISIIYIQDTIQNIAVALYFITVRIRFILLFFILLCPENYHILKHLIHKGIVITIVRVKSNPADFCAAAELSNGDLLKRLLCQHIN